jgi:GTP cyclohydrolase I
MSSCVLRVVHDQAPIDLDAAVLAAAEFLQALGISLDGESMREMPGRMARAYAELFTERPFDLTTFPNDEGDDLSGTLREALRSRAEFLALTGINT